MTEYKIDGENWRDSVISDRQKALLDALENKGSIEVTFYNSNYQAAIEHADAIGELLPKKKWIDLTDGGHVSFVCFRMGDGNIVFKHYISVDTKKVTPPASNE